MCPAHLSGLRWCRFISPFWAMNSSYLVPFGHNKRRFWLLSNSLNPGASFQKGHHGNDTTFYFLTTTWAVHKIKTLLAMWLSSMSLLAWAEHQAWRSVSLTGLDHIPLPHVQRFKATCVECKWLLESLLTQQDGRGTSPLRLPFDFEDRVKPTHFSDPLL